MACAAQTCLAGVTFLCLLSSSRSAAHWLRLRLVLATVPCRRSDSTCKADSQTLRSNQGKCSTIVHTREHPPKGIDGD